MKRFITTLLLSLAVVLVQAQTTPPGKTRADGTFTQIDYYLTALKRLGIPTSNTDALDANTPNANTAKLLWNTSLNKLRVYDGVQWRDAIEADFTDFYTKNQVDSIKTTIDALITDKVSKTGDTMTGTLTTPKISADTIAFGGGTNPLYFGNLDISGNSDGNYRWTQGAVGPKNLILQRYIGSSSSPYWAPIIIANENRVSIGNLDTDTLVIGGVKIKVGGGFGTGTYYVNYGVNDTIAVKGDIPSTSSFLQKNGNQTLYGDLQASEPDVSYTNVNKNGTIDFNNGVSTTTIRGAQSAGTFTATLPSKDGVLAMWGDLEYYTPTSPDITISAGDGYIVKNGRQVTVQFTVFMPTSTSTSYAKLSVPYTPLDYAFVPAMSSYSDTSYYARTYGGKIEILKGLNGSGGYATYADLSGKQLTINMTYITNSL